MSGLAPSPSPRPSPQRGEGVDQDYAHQFNPGFRRDPAKMALVVDMQYASSSRHEGRGFRCLLVEDGCGAASRQLHEAACQNFQRLLGRVDSSARVIAELDAARAAAR
jgi:hypothetical protein